MAETYAGILSIGESRLKENGIDNWDLDAWYLFTDTFALDKARYLLIRNEAAAKEQEGAVQQFFQRIEERVNHKPLQYILREQEFMGLSFYVDERVLIPRQDTETLIEEILQREREKNILLGDICTGSGCIAIALRKLGGYQQVLAADISSAALMVARKNNQRNETSVEFFQGDLFNAFAESDKYSSGSRKFDVIVSNPPYIQSQEILRLAAEVKDYEPHLALDGYQDGLTFYRRLIDEGKNWLKAGGRVYFEIGYDQGEALKNLLKAGGFQDIEIVKDLAGRDRVALARLPGR